MIVDELHRSAYDVPVRELRARALARLVAEHQPSDRKLLHWLGADGVARLLSERGADQGGSS